MTISAGLDFVPLRQPLTRVLAEAHRTLDHLAKEQAERDAIAIRLVKPGGEMARWARKWDEAIAGGGASGQSGDRLEIERMAEELGRSGAARAGESATSAPTTAQAAAAVSAESPLEEEDAVAAGAETTAPPLFDQVSRKFLMKARARFGYADEEAPEAIFDEAVLREILSADLLMSWSAGDRAGGGASGSAAESLATRLVAQSTQVLPDRAGVRRSRCTGDAATLVSFLASHLHVKEANS